jgi:hypothetical protein
MNSRELAEDQARPQSAKELIPRRNIPRVLATRALVTAATAIGTVDLKPQMIEEDRGTHLNQTRQCQAKN